MEMETQLRIGTQQFLKIVKTEVMNGKHNKSFLSFEMPSCKYWGVEDCVQYKLEDRNSAVRLPGNITTIYQLCQPSQI